MALIVPILEEEVEAALEGDNSRCSRWISNLNWLSSRITIRIMKENYHFVGPPWHSSSWWTRASRAEEPSQPTACPPLMDQCADRNQTKPLPFGESRFMGPGWKTDFITDEELSLNEWSLFTLLDLQAAGDRSTFQSWKKQLSRLSKWFLIPLQICAW